MYGTGFYASSFTGFTVGFRPAEIAMHVFEKHGALLSETVCHSTEAMLGFRLTPTAR
jgi:hypothetical protein